MQETLVFRGIHGGLKRATVEQQIRWFTWLSWELEDRYTDTDPDRSVWIETRRTQMGKSLTVVCVAAP